MAEYRRCVICNKPFVAKVVQALCCSPECSKVRRSQKMSAYNKTAYAQKSEKATKSRKKKMSLAQINAEARAAGMTYGQYVGVMGL